MEPVPEVVLNHKKSNRDGAESHEKPAGDHADTPQKRWIQWYLQQNAAAGTKSAVGRVGSHVPGTQNRWTAVQDRKIS